MFHDHMTFQRLFSMRVLLCSFHIGILGAFLCYSLPPVDLGVFYQLRCLISPYFLYFNGISVILCSDFIVATSLFWYQCLLGDGSH